MKTFMQSLHMFATSMNKDLNISEENEPQMPKNVVMDNDPNIENALIEDIDETMLRNNAKTIYNADLTTENELRKA